MFRCSFNTIQAKLEGGLGRGGVTEEGKEVGWVDREGVGVWFHPMRLLLTGSLCLEKSPRWSFGPQGGCITSMGDGSLADRGDRGAR